MNKPTPEFTTFQVGEYFGYSVAVGNFNQDRWEKIILSDKNVIHVELWDMTTSLSDVQCIDWDQDRRTKLEGFVSTTRTVTYVEIYCN